MEHENTADRWKTILTKSFEEQIAFLATASLPDFMKGAAEILHGRSVTTLEAGVGRAYPLSRRKEASGHTVNESIYAGLASDGMLELMYHRSRQTPAHEVVEANSTAVKQRVWGAPRPPAWESRVVEDKAEMQVTQLDPTEEEVLEFRAKFIEALTAKNAQQVANMGKAAITMEANKYL